MQFARNAFVTRVVPTRPTRGAIPYLLPRAAPIEKQATSSASTVADVEVTFHMPYRVIFGQHICITGGCETLGNWDPSNALALDWTDGDVWTTACQLSSGSAIYYKYIIKSEFTSQIIWQSCSNLSIEFPEDVDTLEVQDSWDGCEHTILPVQGSVPTSSIIASIEDMGIPTGPTAPESDAGTVSLPITADADALANDLLAKAMDEELVKTSIDNMPLEKIKLMMTQHGLPPKGRKEQMVDQLKQQMSKNGVTSSKA